MRTTFTAPPGKAAFLLFGHLNQSFPAIGISAIGAFNRAHRVGVDFYRFLLQVEIGRMAAIHSHGLDTLIVGGAATGLGMSFRRPRRIQTAGQLLPSRGRPRLVRVSVRGIGGAGFSG